jgi:multiple sugar transport system permease protein
MKGIPAELNEAATVEGASSWERFRRVTFPSILPVVILMNLFLIIWTSSGIEFVYTLTGGGPGTETMILPVLAYFNMFKADNAGLASAQMVMLLIIVGAVLVLILRRVRFGGESTSA